MGTSSPVLTSGCAKKRGRRAIPAPAAAAARARRKLDRQAPVGKPAKVGGDPPRQERLPDDRGGGHPQQAGGLARAARGDPLRVFEELLELLALPEQRRAELRERELAAGARHQP